MDMDDSSIPWLWDRENSSNSHENESDYYEPDIEFVIKVLESVFPTVDDAERFYYEYGKECGFDVRKESKTTDKETKVVKNREMVCSCAGERKPRKDGDVQMRESKPETRCGCKASFRIARAGEHYVVTKFEPRHNHKLATNETKHLLKCNRYLTPYDKSSLTLLTEGGIRPSQAMDLLQYLLGGAGKLSFMRKDAYNYLNRKRRELIKAGDVNTALSFLEGMKSHDEGLELRYTKADDGTLATLFWCDSMSKSEYEAFGDVLVFDSTYKTNTYQFPLVIFSGVNNHRMTCIFGAAVLHRENLESYRWLLRTFIRTMKKKLPSVVLTDQDVSICSAIEKELPGIPHRLCTWHLDRNAKQNVKTSNFACRFAHLAAKSCPVEEFEKSWAEMIHEFGLADRPWVVDIYEKRKKWSQAYFRHIFLAGMTTTQRAESINALLKLYLKPSLTLTEFMKQYNQTVQKLRSNFIDNQIACEMKKPVVRDGALSDLEKHAAMICTKEIFQRVRMSILEERSITTKSMNKVTDRNYEFIFGKYKNDEVSYKVNIDIDSAKYQCDCMMLESTGVPCPHIICGFKSMDLVEFPKQSIHPRWFIETGTYLKQLFPEPIPKSDKAHTRFGVMWKECLHLCHLTHDNDTLFSQSVDGIRKLVNSVEQCKKKQKMEGGQNTTLHTNVEGHFGDNLKGKGKHNVGDPKKSRTKGSSGSKRHCRHCKNSGHYISTCPDYLPNKERHDISGSKKSSVTQDGAQLSEPPVDVEI